ncbi:uncharacterized protein LOC126375487 [Pectinophora gossypiella]|uniref:uncharacterized protein LOC126375487 n=1 Tax=Pectinophora gossypiella TaxID=13191 RepID=UPI00214EF8C0|nr:uncharacterized protein LOC126375487 [Pectinophora gossypiella]
MKPSMVIVYVIAAAIIVGGEIRIRGKVRKRNTTHRRHREILPPCSFNETIIEDEWSLMEAIGKSKYIFTGKVLNVRKLKAVTEDRKRSNLYRVYFRRVLKGDANELGMFMKLEGSGEMLSGATLVAERPRAREWCAPAPRPRLSAIFLSDGVFTDAVRGPTPRLRLVTDPVPLTLYHLDRINAAVKGMVVSPSTRNEVQFF